MKVRRSEQQKKMPQHRFLPLRDLHHTVIWATMKVEHILLHKLHLRKTWANIVTVTKPIPPPHIPPTKKKGPSIRPSIRPSLPFPISFYHRETFPCEAQHTSRQVNSCDFGKITTRLSEKWQQGTWALDGGKSEIFYSREYETKTKKKTRIGACASSNIQ